MFLYPVGYVLRIKTPPNTTGMHRDSRVSIDLVCELLVFNPHCGNHLDMDVFDGVEDGFNSCSTVSVSRVDVSLAASLLTAAPPL